MEFEKLQNFSKSKYNYNRILHGELEKQANSLICKCTSFLSKTKKTLIYCH